MGISNYSDDFKRDAVAQITERGYPVREVSRRLGVSAYSLYKWLKLYGAPTSKRGGVDHEAENRRLKRDLARVTEERDILKKGDVILDVPIAKLSNACQRTASSGGRLVR